MKTIPLVSYCIFSYNQESYILNALEGAVNQNYENLEIIVSDDASSDRTYKIIEDFKNAYSGPHSLVINRNEENLGIGGHFSKVLYDVAHGDYIIVLGADDSSKHNHVSLAVKEMLENPDIPLIDFNADVIDAQGVFRRVFQDLKYDSVKYTLQDYYQITPLSTFAPGRIIRKEMLLKFGPIASNCPTEDSVLVLRSLCTGGMMRVNKNLVNYRVHENNISGVSNIQKISVLPIIYQYIADITKLYNDKNISGEESVKLIRRVLLEIRLRDLRHNVGSNTFYRVLNRFRYKSYVLIHRFLLNYKI